MASHHEIVDFIENIRAEMPARLHGFYEEAVDRALEQQHKRGKEFAKQIIKSSPMIRREFDHQKEEEGLLAIFVLIVGFLGGAALMYLFDPDRGEQRRASLLGQVNHAAHEASDSLHDTANQVRDQADKNANNVSDSLKETTSQVRDQASKAASSASSSVKAASEQVNAAVSDVTLTARVRAEIARSVRSPGAVEVAVSEGVVTLKGQIPSSEVKSLVEKVQAVSGVKKVENRLEIHDATSTGAAPSGAGNNGTPS